VIRKTRERAYGNTLAQVGSDRILCRSRLVRPIVSEIIETEHVSDVVAHLARHEACELDPCHTDALFLHSLVRVVHAPQSLTAAYPSGGEPPRNIFLVVGRGLVAAPGKPRRRFPVE
jgi:hypothetical protein